MDGQGKPSAGAAPARAVESITNTLYVWLRGISIRTRLWLVLLLVVAVLTFALVVMLRSIVASYEASVGFINTQLVRSVSEELKGNLSSLMNTTKYPIIWVDQLPTSTYTYLSYPDKYPRTIMENDLQNQSKRLLEENQHIRLIAVFDTNGKGSYVKNTKKYIFQATPNQQKLDEKNRVAEPWFVQTLRGRGSAQIWNASQISLEDAFLQDAENLLFVSRAIINIERFDPVGIVLAAADVSDVQSLFASGQVYDEQNIAMLDSDGPVLWGEISDDAVSVFHKKLEQENPPASAGTFQAIVKGQRVIFDYAQTLDGQTCVLTTPYALLLAAVIKEKLTLIIGLGLGFLLVSIVLDSIVRSVRKPVHSLVETCNQIVAEGDFSITIDDPHRDELSELTKAFNNLTQRIFYLIHEVYEKQMELSQTQLQLLRSQVNPHFLYNTLETIRTKAFLCGHEEVADITLLLASLLRYGISAPSELVTVETEVQKLMDYIGLQQMLYENRFTLTTNIEPEVMSCRMLKFIFQPLVENALTHGVNPMDEASAVDVLGYLEGDTIVLNVSDNGKGITPRRLQELRDYLDNKNDKINSIGLKNVHRRIRLFYGEAYGLTISSRTGSGTLITVRMPRFLMAGSAKPAGENSRV